MQYDDVDEERTSEAGLVLVGYSALTDEDRKTAKVIDVGVATDHAGEVLNSIIKPGMRIIADKDYGEEFEWKGETYHIFRNFALTGYLPAEDAQ